MLKKMSDSLRTDIEQAQQQIYKLAGIGIQYRFPKQLGEVLFILTQTDGEKKDENRAICYRGRHPLAKLADEHEIARKILEYREYEKLRSTYVDALPRMVSRTDGRHPDFRQAVCRHGPTEFNNPNLQNIPIRTEKRKIDPGAFVPRDKNFLSMSSRLFTNRIGIAASFAKDATMIEAFRNKRDIHTTQPPKFSK